MWLKRQQELESGIYTGVAEPCKEIHKDKDAVYDYTSKGKKVPDSTAVLGWET